MAGIKVASAIKDAFVDPIECRRRVLFAVVSALLSENGFDSAGTGVIETLVEMLQSILVELGRSSKAYAELAGRTEPFLGDVSLAMTEMGLSIHSLPAYLRRPGASRYVISAAAHAVQPPITRALQTGEKLPHPAYIPDYLPPFPDTHSYIKTPTTHQVSTEYEEVREKAASQKRDVERALTKFIAKTGNVHGLFMDDPTAFPLIACQRSAQPYLNALLSKDQNFEDLEVQTQEKASDTGSISAESIDNPYLRPVRLPRAKKRRQ
ncbi:PREDICTED: transcription initiation factor TFIID subunit 8-like isoform X2 [Priapulus caudatus]|nr:PREDICTED: transcription initiation factor TFIID subunit 8-like isoform X2 [Priapulus caudatus]XP_014675144.1 PREDICTED: transcription initiation factor TFIID subunit 8-like isoform X2 [Priapulus caudatus]